MGAEQSVQQSLPEEYCLREQYSCLICYELLPANTFRVLQCGHYYCFNCIEEWAKEEIISCPSCREEDISKVEMLCTIKSFKGKIYFEEPSDDLDNFEINFMLHQQMVRRAKTIRFLYATVDEVSTIEFTGAGVKIGGSVLGLIGSGMMITGTALALTVVGAPVGAPIAIAGAAVGGAGGLFVGGGMIGEAITKSKHLEGADKHLCDDYFHSVQLQILIGRSSKDKKFAKRFGIPAQDAGSILAAIGKITKFGLAAGALARGVALGVGRGAGVVGLHVAGMVISAAVIPLDLAQMVVSSIKIHKKNKSKVLQDIEKTAKELEKELWLLLKEDGYNFVELKRNDDNNVKQQMLVAVKDNKINEALGMSVKDIEKKFIVICSSFDKTINEETYLRVIDFWAESNDDVVSGC